MPLLTEWGGRVNRVGVTRREIKSEIEDYGFFVEFTRDSLDFDTDSELYSHISREALYASSKIMDTLIQKDLISKAKPHIAGTAVSVDAMDATSELAYKTFVKFNQKLDAVKAPRKTKLVTGSRNTDTKVIPNARYLMYPSELQEQLESMQNFHGKEAFIGSEHYGAATTLANSELGKVGRFRMIQVDNMIDNTEKSLVVADPLFYSDDAGNFKVFPLLYVASESFVSTTFHHTGGKKIDIIVQKPGSKTADRHDPYGKTGFYSVQFWYGILIEREEWLQKILCTAKS
jgi:N4-gp56 family major capsid protein